MEVSFIPRTSYLIPYGKPSKIETEENLSILDPDSFELCDISIFEKAHTGTFTVWYEAWFFCNTYLQNNLGKTRVLFFRKEL